MRISIIIPTYNRAEVILRSLQTWASQTCAADDFELIIVDNNSSDGSDAIIKDFIKDKPNFRYVLETQKGSTYARHAGAALAKADILMFCDDDGLFNPFCLEEILKVFDANSQVSAVTGKIVIEWDKTPPEWIEPYEFMLGKLDYGDEIQYNTSFYLNGGILAIKKQVFEDLGGFNPDLIGDYLVGDGDTGLVIKLHKNKMLIGYTPFATMKHLQFVNIQGTEKDMGRRFYNVGISETYGLFRENNFKFNFPIIKYIGNSLAFGIKKQLESLITQNRKAYFGLMKRKGELVFFLNLFRKDIRKEILK